MPARGGHNIIRIVQSARIPNNQRDRAPIVQSAGIPNNQRDRAPSSVPAEILQSPRERGEMEVFRGWLREPHSTVADPSAYVWWCAERVFKTIITRRGGVFHHGLVFRLARRRDISPPRLPVCMGSVRRSRRLSGSHRTCRATAVAPAAPPAPHTGIDNNINKKHQPLYTTNHLLTAEERTQLCLQSTPNSLDKKINEKKTPARLCTPFLVSDLKPTKLTLE